MGGGGGGGGGRGCSEVYIGEMGRPLKTMITEHKWAVNQMDTKNANAVDRSKVIDREKRWKERKIKEGINPHQKTHNLQSGPTESSVDLPY